ncbi:MAG: hypothetical protein ACI9RO_001912 [Alteromonas macleodii]|jgi:hypothetical protein
MACLPWVSRFEWREADLNNFPNIKDWYLRIAARPTVQAGYSVPKFTCEAAARLLNMTELKCLRCAIFVAHRFV